MSRRSPEQVHDEDGHGSFVASCGRCATEVEADRNAEEARAELAAAGGVPVVGDVVVGEQGPEPVTPAADVTVVTHADGSFTVPAGHTGPLPDADPNGSPDDAVPLPAEPARARRALTADGRPKCYLNDCPLPEFADDMGLCGGHWSTRPDLRKEARHG